MCVINANFNPHKGRLHMVYHRAQSWWPFCFIIYINDQLLNIQGAKLIMYADNTNDLITDRSPDTLQTKPSLVVKQLEFWFLNNDLIINSSKTFVCHSSFATQY